MTTSSSNLICPTCGNVIAFSELTLYHETDNILRCSKCGYEFKRGKEGIENTVIDYLRSNKEMQAIQYYRHATASDLKASKDYIEDVAKRYGIELKKCFIATACYGADSTEVDFLRNFRDNKLLKSFYGKVFVKVYYYASPFVFDTVYSNKLLKNYTVKLLNAFIKLIKKT